MEADQVPEWHPHDVYDSVNPSNPIEVHVKPERLVEWMSEDIALLEEGLNTIDPTGSDHATVSEFIKRRREVIRWAEAYGEGPIRVGLYPGFHDPEVLREEAIDSELKEKPYIVFWRLRRSLDDDHAYWKQWSTRPKTETGEAVFQGFLEWAELALDAVLKLRYTPELERLALQNGIVVPIKRADWPSMATSEVTFPYLSLLVAERSFDMTVKGAFRVKDIIDLVIEEHPAADVSAFLERLAGLYLWGFDSECYVLARATLESALKQSMSDEEVRSALGRRDVPKRYPDLGDRINAARVRKLLTSDDAKIAHKIRQDGNDVVHEFPNANLHFATPLDVIRSLMRLVSGLIGSAGR
jgi:hypothetical protein